MNRKPLENNADVDFMAENDTIERKIKMKSKSIVVTNLIDAKPSYNISFNNGTNIIGTLDFNGSEMIFVGNAKESAKVFFNFIAESFKVRLEEEYQKGYMNARI